MAVRTEVKDRKKRSYEKPAITYRAKIEVAAWYPTGGGMKVDASCMLG